MSSCLVGVSVWLPEGPWFSSNRTLALPPPARIALLPVAPCCGRWHHPPFSCHVGNRGILSSSCPSWTQSSLLLGAPSLTSQSECLLHLSPTPPQRCQPAIRVENLNLKLICPLSTCPPPSRPAAPAPPRIRGGTHISHLPGLHRPLPSRLFPPFSWMELPPEAIHSPSPWAVVLVNAGSLVTSSGKRPVRRGAGQSSLPPASHCSYPCLIHDGACSPIVLINV